MADGTPPHELTNLHKRVHQLEAEIAASSSSSSSFSSSTSSSSASSSGSSSHKKKKKSSSSEKKSGGMNGGGGGAGGKVSTQEKRQLQADIYSLNQHGGQLQGVIEIISRSMHIDNPEEEIEIDIDNLSPSTIRELQKHVKQCLEKMKEEKKQQGIDFSPEKIDNNPSPDISGNGSPNHPSMGGNQSNRTNNNRSLLESDDESSSDPDSD